MFRKIDRKEFFTRNAIEIAPDLLGKLFVKKDKNEYLAGIITETEAYCGIIDEASHSFKGRTNRNGAMFQEGGVIYVYFIYGNHFCVNIVTGQEGIGEAVLIRSMQPLSGIKLMQENRWKYSKRKFPITDDRKLLNGPGKICQAFNIDNSNNEKSLFGDNLFIAELDPSENIEYLQTERIGISKSKEFKWRFLVKDSEYVSR